MMGNWPLCAAANDAFRESPKIARGLHLSSYIANTTFMTRLNSIRRTRKHFLAQDCPQLGVERGGVEDVFVVAPVCLVRVPVGEFADASLAGRPRSFRHNG